MSEPQIIFTEAYEQVLDVIEDFIFTSSQDEGALERFWHEHDQAIRFITENPKTPAAHPATGDQSWPFADGRYRLFFKYVMTPKTKVVYLTHIVDNRRANLKIYPRNKLPTYDEN